LGVAPKGAIPEFFREKGMQYPPDTGPLAAVTPGTPGGILVMLAEYGTLSLADVLDPAIRMADGYAIEAETADKIERNKETIKQWPAACLAMLPRIGGTREAPAAGELFRQPDLAATLRRLVEAEADALAQGKSRKQALQAAYDCFYRGDIANEFIRGVQDQGGLITLEDLSNWQVYIEQPVKTEYKGIDVYKLTTWVQGPVLLQMLNMLENMDLRSMGYNSARYIHTLYQTMNLAYADRDFYYGDPYFPPEEPIRGLLSKAYARARAGQINPERNDAAVAPGDPYPFQGGTNPFRSQLDQLKKRASASVLPDPDPAALERFRLDFNTGTTSVVAADSGGWVVAATPSGGWIPAVIAGRTGIGMSQRMQSFVVDKAENPFNVVAPGKRPRATLTPSLALKGGKPFLAFAVQGGDTQDQNLLQFFLNMVEFKMNVQEAAEAANFNSYQMHSSFGKHEARPGGLLLNFSIPPWVRDELKGMGYDLSFAERTSGPINAVTIDSASGTLWGGSSHHGEDYGVVW
jgi:gamma-glutamyltranspeptidase/glutathione hydrolase